MEKEIKAEVLKHGVILGFISITITLLCYLIDITLLADWKMSIGILILYLAVLIFFGRKFRNEYRDGYMTFGQAFLYSFVVILMSGVISLAFQILLYEVIDPELPKALIKVSLENMEKTMRSVGVGEDKISATLDGSEAQIRESFTALGIIKNSWGLLISLAITALITGLFIKKRRPELE